MEVAASRKQWRAVSQDTELGKAGQSDERTIYEEGAGPGRLDVDFCSITIDAGEPSDDDMLQERLRVIAQQREELHQMEVEIQARSIARSEILEMQNVYEDRIKEHANVASKLKEQLQESDQHIIELEMKLEEKDRELRAVKIDNESAWAKDDLLREQNKELATFRRERDNSEAERAQNLQKIHDLQEHIQDKESRFMALDEQHRVAQETILFKDEQLREAQTWIARAQEMDALHSTTNQSLQAELRERTEQFNQYWIGLQRQFAEIERHHLQTIQQLQLELAETRERNGTYKDGSQVARDNPMGGSSYDQNKGNQINVNGDTASNGNSGFVFNGNLDSSPSPVSASSASTKTEHVSGVPLVPSSIVGMGAFLPPGQMTALHPIVMHPQGVPPSLSSTNSLNPHSHLGHFQPVSTAPAQHWQKDQAVPDISQVDSQQVINQNTHQPSQTEKSLMRPDAQYSYQHCAEREVIHPGHFNSSIYEHQRPYTAVNSPSDGVQVFESNGSLYQVSQEPLETANANLQVHASLEYDPPKRKSEVQDEKTVAAINQSEEQVLASGEQRVASSVVTSTAENHPVSSNNVAECNDNLQTSGSLIHRKAVEPTLLDERSLLACIVRAIPAGSDGRVRISSTLPNRLGKMLAPLHWHDYKKYYGKLDDFVSRHPELFVIEGDFIHLREGAQEIISATTAYAKVAAAAAASSAPYSSLLPSVAVTPVAQNIRHKKATPIDSKPASTVLSTVENGASLDRATLAPSQIKELSNVKPGSGGRQQGRSSSAGLNSRRRN